METVEVKNCKKIKERKLDILLIKITPIGNCIALLNIGIKCC
jgi:hypothetical protein